MISAAPIAFIVFAGFGLAAMSVVAIPRAVKDAEKMSALQIGLLVLSSFELPIAGLPKDQRRK